MSNRSIGVTIVVCGVVLLATVSVEVVAQTPDGPSARDRADAAAARADSLGDQRQLDAALQAYQRALRLYREAGAKREAAEILGDMGVMHYFRDDYDTAQHYFQRALTAARAVQDRDEVAAQLSNLGLTFKNEGRYEKALEHYQEALQMNRTREDRESVAANLTNIGVAYEYQGQYGKALEHYKSALQIDREVGDRRAVATNLDNVGDIQRKQGRYEAAAATYEEALRLNREAGYRTDVADNFTSLGVLRWNQRRYDDALEYYRNALEIAREEGDRSSLAANLNNVGTVQEKRGNDEEAIARYREALAINRDLDNPVGIAANLSGIGDVHRKQGAYPEALQKYRQVLQMHRDHGRTDGVARALDDLGQTHLAAGRYAEADSLFSKAVDTTERLLRTASGADRRDFLAKEVDRFQALITTRVRAGRPEAALRAAERSRARLLSEQLSGEADSMGTVPPVDSLLKTVGPDEAAVHYANIDADHPLTVLIVTRDSVRARDVADTTVLRRAHSHYRAALERLQVRDEMPWGRPSEPLLRRAKGVRVDPEAEGLLANLIRLYRHDVSVGPKKQVLSNARRRQLGQFLYSILMEPIEEEVADRDQLIVVPDGALNYLPFEVLSDWDQTRVIERWQVRYAQSLRVLSLLRERSDRTGSSARPEGLLAIGGAVYNSSATAVDTADGSGGPVAARARSVISESRPGTDNRRPRGDAQDTPTSRYRDLGYGPDRWQNLPGTSTEVRALGRIAEPSTLVLDKEASEQTIHTLSQSGTLEHYRAIHFATHGFVVPEEPELSALVLSEVRNGRGENDRLTRDPRSGGSSQFEDGYLSMREIAALNLNAEFVAVSACRTGVGRIYRGSGAVSLAQAFFRAGAESVAVSLWSIYDASTSRFMEAVYERAWGRETTWSSAITQTKRAFAKGHYGERLQDPRFWAPFVYYGHTRGRDRE